MGTSYCFVYLRSVCTSASSERWPGWRQGSFKQRGTDSAITAQSAGRENVTLGAKMSRTAADSCGHFRPKLGPCAATLAATGAVSARDGHDMRSACVTSRAGTQSQPRRSSRALTQFVEVDTHGGELVGRVLQQRQRGRMGEGAVGPWPLGCTARAALLGGARGRGQDPLGGSCERTAAHYFQGARAGGSPPDRRSARSPAPRCRS